MKIRWISALALALVPAACAPSPGPQSGSQTNWLVRCESSSECGGLDCVCGACTTSCDTDAVCGELPGASCVEATDQGAIAFCGGQAPPAALCLPRCDENGACPHGTSCLAGVCTPTGPATASVTLDPDTRHEELIGFGASLAFADEQIVAHPQKAALFDQLFGETGIDVLRLRNRFQDGDEQAVMPAAEIVSAAEERIGRRPVLFLVSGTPPAALKANNSRTCAGDETTCTLVSLPSGGFDYAGFASYWRGALEAYATAGIRPDYFSIQNNPNWVPPSDAGNEACRFLPEEGTSTVTVDGASVEVTYPGYREALVAVRAAIANLPNAPRLGIPDTGPVMAADYVQVLDASTFDGVALHMYGIDPADVDVENLQALRALARQLGRPVFQTEMRAGGLDTAILIHHAFTNAGASTYIQNDLVSLGNDTGGMGLTFVGSETFELQPPFYTFSHYAKSTDPGWIRVDASSDSAALLGTAWLSPNEDALTIVLVNSGVEELDAQIVVPEPFRTNLGRGEIRRTVFDGIERFALLGSLGADSVVRIPGRSIVTVAFASE